MTNCAREVSKSGLPLLAERIARAATDRASWRGLVTFSGVVVVLTSSCVLPDFNRLTEAVGGKTSAAGLAGSAGLGLGGALNVSRASSGGTQGLGGMVRTSPNTERMAGSIFGVGGGAVTGVSAGAGIGSLGGTTNIGGAAAITDTTINGGTVSATGGVSNGGTDSSGGTIGAAGTPVVEFPISAGTAGTSISVIPPTGRPFVPVTASAKSCNGLGDICQGESCCTSIEMPGGTFPMGRSEVSGASDFYSGGGTSEIPEHSATVASFALDKYEVTVGRFRNFVADYNAWHTNANPTNPTSAAGAHPTAPNTGWGQSWNASAADLPADSTALIASLKCNSSYQTWTDNAGIATEAYPVNCVTWYQAFAFCIWDGGRLSTEAEWEYAAAGGAQNRLYPWGSQTPEYARANYYDSTPAGSVFTPIGSKLASGAGYFNHADLAGSMWEWVLDWYNATYYGAVGSPIVCNNCANCASSSYRVLRGGSWNDSAFYLRAASRYNYAAANRFYSIGFRCARTP